MSILLTVFLRIIPALTVFLNLLNYGCLCMGSLDKKPCVDCKKQISLTQAFGNVQSSKSKFIRSDYLDTDKPKIKFSDLFTPKHRLKKQKKFKKIKELPDIEQTCLTEPANLVTDFKVECNESPTFVSKLCEPEDSAILKQEELLSHRTPVRPTISKTVSTAQYFDAAQSSTASVLPVDLLPSSLATPPPTCKKFEEEQSPLLSRNSPILSKTSPLKRRLFETEDFSEGLSCELKSADVHLSCSEQDNESLDGDMTEPDDANSMRSDSQCSTSGVNTQILDDADKLINANQAFIKKTFGISLANTSLPKRTKLGKEPKKVVSSMANHFSKEPIYNHESSTTKSHLRQASNSSDEFVDSSLLEESDRYCHLSDNESIPHFQTEQSYTHCKGWSEETNADDLVPADEKPASDPSEFDDDDFFDDIEVQKLSKLAQPAKPVGGLVGMCLTEQAKVSEFEDTWANDSQLSGKSSSVPDHIATKGPMITPSCDGRPPACPSYKLVEGTLFAVDAFLYGPIPGVTAYFLSHFHADHYQGIGRNTVGPIYCCEITAKLVYQRLMCRTAIVHTLPIGPEVFVQGIGVRLMHANHCPGSVMFLFRLPDGRQHLHTGDFRADAPMQHYPFLAAGSVDRLYLDTTYCDEQYTFPPQADMVRLGVELVLRARREEPASLIVAGTYIIGKERLFMAMAEALKCKVHVTKDKLRAMQCFASEWPAVKSLLTDNWNDPQIGIYVFSVNAINEEELDEFLTRMRAQHPHRRYRRVVAFDPRGWRMHDGDLRRPASHTETVSIYGVPYSEHSSFAELRSFVQWLRPRSIIPTVEAKSAAEDALVLQRLDAFMGRGPIDRFLD